ncbi:MBL fold metallo-hydrolase [Roseibium sp.]|uniref:MBL fold metallo-hydrolase n=1 Tax=Roseibium sp. TaxID=1936156 RepID=UPI003A9819A4
MIYTPTRRGSPIAILAILFLAVAAQPAFAVCQLVADASGFQPNRVQAALAPGDVRIRYIGHSTFELETPQGVRIATDYNDSIRPLQTPTVATMNRAHSTHYSQLPDPDIEHLLPGWSDDGSPVDYDLTVKDVRIRNIQTNIRGWDGDTRRLGNSIFIFEVADLCIAHLGHLHHRLTQEDLTRLGQIDIVFAAIDNTSTLRIDSLMEVLAAISPSLVIPMHFHFHGALETFMARAQQEGFSIQQASDSELIARRDTLPSQKTTYIMLPGGG